MDYAGIVSEFLKSHEDAGVAAIDLETLLGDSVTFLSGERIIAVSISWIDSTGFLRSAVSVADGDDPDSEYNILQSLDSHFESIDPSIILGYNHTGYDIPLIQMKIKRLQYNVRLRNIEKYFGTSWCLDLMYAIADDLWKYEGEYYIRKLDDVVIHERYKELPLMRVKDLVRLNGKTKGEAIRFLWENDRQKFVKYALGDSRDLILIFCNIFGLKLPKL